MQTTQRLFTNYISAGVQASLDRVHAAEYIVPEADRQQAWHILSFALDAPTAWQVTRELLLALAPKMEQAGFREEWIPYLEKGVHCAQNIGDGRVAAECELQIGLLYRLLSRFDEASRWTMASVEHFAAQGDAQGQARALNELAWLEHLQHHYEAANRYLAKAMEQSPDNDFEQAVSYRVKGMIALSQRQWQDAERMHQKALELFTYYRDKRRIAWSLVNIGVSLVEQVKLEEAIFYYQLAAARLHEISDTYNFAIVQMNLGVAYHRLGKPSESLLYCTKAKNFFDKMNDILSLARIHTNLGLCNLALHNSEEAEYNFISAIDLYTKLEDQAWRVNAMDGLGMTYMAMEQYDKAMQVFQQALRELDVIKSSPYFDKFYASLTLHLQETYQNKLIQISHF